MRLDFRIANRYLFAKKSHNVINIISLISAVGIAIGTAALVLVMSVYNGFESVVRGAFDGVGADFIVSPSSGKTFVPDSAAVAGLRGDPSISSLYEVVEDNVFITYGEKQGVALAKGVVDGYNGYELYFGEIANAVVGGELASQMRINPHFVEPLDVYYPMRESEMSVVNPMSSLNSCRLFPSQIVRIETSLDKQIVFMPIEKAREIFDYSEEVSYLEVNVAENADAVAAEQLCRSSFPDCQVKNRYQQKETVYKMMKYEKFAIYMILVFVIIIISFNVLGSLTMLIMEKSEDIRTLRFIGAEDGLIRRIFICEGWMITLYGMLAGLVVGIVVCLLQQQFGLVKMDGNFIVSAYPVVLQFSDILITSGIIAAIGFIIAYIPSSRVSGRVC